MLNNIHFSAPALCAASYTARCSTVVILTEPQPQHADGIFFNTRLAFESDTISLGTIKSEITPSIKFDYTNMADFSQHLTSIITYHNHSVVLFKATTEGS